MSTPATLRDLVIDPPHPDATFVFTSPEHGGITTVGELAAKAGGVAAELARRGLAPGDTIAVQLPNWPACVVTYLATALLGATVLPIPHIYGPSEVEFILRQAGAKLFVVPDHWRSTDFSRIIAAAATVATVEDIVVVGGDVPTGCTPWGHLQDRAGSPPLVPSDPDELCLLVYTSGTTADPKGVQHSHRTFLAEISSTAGLSGGPGAPVLQVFPAGHIAGYMGVMRPLILGTPTVCMDAWDAALAARLVEEHRITFTAGTPFHLTSLLDAADADGCDLSSLISYLCGAASVPPSLIERGDARGLRGYRSYGSSEHPTVSSVRRDDPADLRASTDGQLLPGSEVRLIDEDGHDVGVGQEGEIASRGPELFVGYRDPALDRDAFLPGRWYRSGDIGRLSDGYLTVTDRKKDIIIRGGENISSREVEDILVRHPAIADAAVIGVPDARYGERVCAVILPAAGSAVGLDDIQRHFAASGVARQKIPERVEAVDELPRTAAGKVKKFELRRRFT